MKKEITRRGTTGRIKFRKKGENEVLKSDLLLLKCGGKHMLLSYYHQMGFDS